MASLVFDVGANHGEWSKQNLQAGLAKRIIAVEASPTTFDILRSRISSSQIELIHSAVSAKPGVITFYNASAHTLSTTNKDWLTSPESRFCGTKFQEVTVPTVTLDKMIEVYGQPDLIKIDVEGGELDAVRSLTQKVHLLCFEWATEVNPITFQCIDYLQSLGFTRFFVQMRDDYTFRPSTQQLSSTAEQAKEILSQTVPKEDWGMMWCA